MGTEMMRGPMFGGHFPMSNDAKRDAAWADYGYPQTLTFANFWGMYQRSGIARAGVMRHVEKTWETDPWVSEDIEDHGKDDQTSWEREVSAVFRRAQLWNRLSATDWRNRVGRYAALYLVFDDNQNPDQPVQGARRLLAAQPVLESQLTPVQWDQDTKSPEYGMPLFYQFHERALGNDDPGQNRSVTIHADRIHIMAEGADDGGIMGMSALEPGFNALLDIEKIRGSGGEGFWKAARGAFALSGEVDENKLARMFGVEVGELAGELDNVAKDFAAGFDKLLMLGGMEAQGLSFSVPTPEQFFAVAMQDFSASVSCPMPVLIGQQISQRSSDENSKEWAQTIMSRRRRFVGPNIEALVRKLMRLGVISFKEDFRVEWDDLTEPSVSDKLANAKTASEVNKAAMGTGEAPPFRPNEIRELAGYDADTDLNDDDDEPEGGDARAADSSALDE